MELQACTKRLLEKLLEIHMTMKYEMLFKMLCSGFLLLGNTTVFSSQPTSETDIAGKPRYKGMSKRANTEGIRISTYIFLSIDLI